MFNVFRKSDAHIQQDVTNELKWDPSVTAAHVSVTVTSGIVTLRGSVPHYYEKRTAEEAAQRVGGVRAVADEIEVSLLGSYERTDEDIARTALMALEWHYQVPKDLKVVVQNGWVTLKGDAVWEYQRNAAVQAVATLMGVRGVTNDIALKSSVKPEDIKTRIEEALSRSAENEGHLVNVLVEGNRVTLSGNLHSFAEVEDARIAAWSAPGVTSVKNNLKIAA